MHRHSIITFIRFTLLIISLLHNRVVSQQYNVNNFSESSSVSNAFIYSLTKDSLGYIWIGTADGLIRFNGKSFYTFTTADSLSDNFISCAVNDGRFLWTGHMNGSLSFYNQKKFEKVPLNTENPGPVTCFDKDPAGVVWMSTYNGMLMRLDRSPSVTAVKRFRADEALLAFVFTDYRTILAGTSSGLYQCRITTSDDIQIERRISESEQIVNVIRNYEGSAYYAASSGNRIYALNHRLNVIDTIESIPGIQSICSDRFNTLWIATFGKGLINYDPEEKKSVSFLETTGENVKTVLAGDDGNIWAGGYGTGLRKISHQIFTFLEYPKNIYGFRVKAICHEGKNSWIATEKGIMKADLTGSISYFSNTLANKITSLSSDRRGNIWIGTENDGVFMLDEYLMLKKVYMSSGTLEQSVTSLAASDNFMWVGTKKGLCRIDLDDLQIKWYTISDGIPHNSINGLLAKDEGKIWISSRSNILAYLKNDMIERFLIRSPNPAISFSEFTVDRNNFVWAGTMGNGLYRLGGDSVLNLTSESGLLSDFCHNLIHDNRGQIWAIHKDGLSRISSRDNFIRTFAEFGTIGEKFSFMPLAASIDDDGKIWLGTDNGVLLIDQSKDTDGLPPVPHILSIRINNEEYQLHQGRILLKPGKYNIRIEFGAISQKEPDMITYTMFLEGYDQQPEITRQNTVEYRNLTEGAFTFTVSALNGDGVSSQLPVELEILIRTPLLKQWWFYLIAFFTVCGLIFGYIKRREFMFRQERAILEEKVHERTREIQEQKDEIEHQRDLIRLKNAEITSSIRYAQEIQNALLPPESKFDRYFPDNFIFIRPKDIVSGDFYWLARKNERIIFTVADCTGHGVPGGFMSMLSISLLNEIVNVEGITDSDRIVSRLHALVHKSLNRSRTDGLDMALCSYDFTNRIIQFTGAMNHLVYFRNDEQYVLKADQYSVNMKTDEEVIFSMKELKLQKGDMIYLFSDGYMDQFGGEKDKKFSVKRFYCLLQEIHQLPLKDQETILDQRLSDWKKDRIQTDDITIMGIRF